MEYLEGAIDEGVGACIYISGVPGIGKTATVREVVRALNERVESGVRNTVLRSFYFLSFQAFVPSMDVC